MENLFLRDTNRFAVRFDIRIAVMLLNRINLRNQPRGQLFDIESGFVAFLLGLKGVEARPGFSRISGTRLNSCMYPREKKINMNKYDKLEGKRKRTQIKGYQ